MSNESNEMIITVLADFLGDGHVLQIQPDPSKMVGYSIVSEEYLDAAQLRELANEHFLTVFGHAVDPAGQLNGVQFTTIGTKANIPPDLGSFEFDQPVPNVAEALRHIPDIIGYLTNSLEIEVGQGVIPTALLILSANPSINLG